MLRRFGFLLVVLIAFSALGQSCAPVDGNLPSGSPGPTLDFVQQAELTVRAVNELAWATAQATETQRARLSTQEQATAAAGATASILQTQSARSTQAAQTQAAAKVTQTQSAVNAEVTAAALAEGTAQASDMEAFIDDLVEAGYLESSAGRWISLPDFEQVWDDPNAYQYWRTPVHASSFAVRAQLSWEVDDEQANLFDTGCGFVFREEDVENHLIALLALDGNAYFFRVEKGAPRLMGSGKWGKPGALNGDVELSLLVNGSAYALFVDGKQTASVSEEAGEAPGFAFTLNSGAQDGFDTRCEFKGIEVWELAGLEEED